MHLSRCLIAQRLVGPFVIVEAEIVVEAVVSVGDGLGNCLGPPSNW